MLKAAIKEEGVAGGETNPSLPGFFLGAGDIHATWHRSIRRRQTKNQTSPVRSSHLGDPNRAGGRPLSTQIDGSGEVQVSHNARRSIVLQVSPYAGSRAICSSRH